MSHCTAPRVSLATGGGAVLCRECRVADSFWSRLRGLVATRRLRRSEGLLIPGTSSIHTHFMRFPIDVVFVGVDGRVLKIARGLRPWRFARCRGAADVVELGAGECERLGLVESAVLLEAPDGVTGDRVVRAGR